MTGKESLEAPPRSRNIPWSFKTSSLQDFSSLMLLFVLLETLGGTEQNCLWKMQALSTNLISKVISHENDHLNT